MAKLIYAAITSLDGYIADASGKFDWAAPDEEVQAFVNELERPVGTYLYGRKMYQTMAAWETPDAIPDPTPAVDTSRLLRRLGQLSGATLSAVLRTLQEMFVE